nr:reverse transcriptase domain-containing protein [Tanacetum cinerariifolium]
MPKFGPSIKSLLTYKDKLFELARTLLNEHCSAVLLKKLPEKLKDPGKFLIPCDFPVMDECLSLVDLGASINLMPLSVWNKLSLLKLTPTLMTLELADRSISRPIGVAKDVYTERALIDVYAGELTFRVNNEAVAFNLYQTSRYSANYNDMTANRIDVIDMALEDDGKCIRTRRALIDVYAGELTLRVNNEAVTFNLDQTLRYSSNYNDMTANRIEVIDMAYEECSQEVLGFSDVIVSGNPTPYYDPIVSTSSPTLTPFENSDFLLGEVDAFLALEDDLTSPEVDHSYFDTEGDILLFEAFLNDDPSLPHPTQGILEYRGKTALIKVLKSHKQAIAWKLSDTKGIDPEFCTHKILMEDDFEPTDGVYALTIELNEATRKDHFTLPSMDQMLERLAGNEYYCFLD